MKAFRNRYLPVAMIAGLAVLGVACDEDAADDDPAIEDDGLEGEGEGEDLGEEEEGDL